MRHTVTIDEQKAWLVTDRETGHTLTFRCKQAAEVYLDCQENRLPHQETSTASPWKALLFAPLAALGF